MLEDIAIAGHIMDDGRTIEGTAVRQLFSSAGQMTCEGSYDVVLELTDP